MVNMPETIARDICIKIEKASGNLQAGVVLEKNPKHQKTLSMFRFDIERNVSLD